MAKSSIGGAPAGYVIRNRCESCRCFFFFPILVTSWTGRNVFFLLYVESNPRLREMALLRHRRLHATRRCYVLAYTDRITFGLESIAKLHSESFWRVSRWILALSTAFWNLIESQSLRFTMSATLESPHEAFQYLWWLEKIPQWNSFLHRCKRFA